METKGVESSETPRTTEVSAASDREIVISRRFDAPRDLVYKVWTNPEHIGAWWGPRGFSTTTHEMDLRSGGLWRFIMHGPDGTDYKNRIEYVEVVEPERLVYWHGGENDDSQPFHVTVTFSQQDEVTEVTMIQRYATVEDRQMSVKFGAVDGGNQTFDRLSAYLKTL